MTQGELAELLHIDRTYVSKIECGVPGVSDVGLLAQFAATLGVSPVRLGLAGGVAERPGVDLVGRLDRVFNQLDVALAKLELRHALAAEAAIDRYREFRAAGVGEEQARQQVLQAEYWT